MYGDEGQRTPAPFDVNGSALSSTAADVMLEAGEFLQLIAELPCGPMLRGVEHAQQDRIKPGFGSLFSTGSTCWGGVG